MIKRQVDGQTFDAMGPAMERIAHDAPCSFGGSYVTTVEKFLHFVNFFANTFSSLRSAAADSALGSTLLSMSAQLSSVAKTFLSISPAEEGNFDFMYHWINSESASNSAAIMI